MNDEYGMMTNYDELIAHFTRLNESTCEAKAVALGRQGETGLPMLAQLMQADDVDVRFWAVRGLWANASPAAVDWLVEALQDTDEMVRSGAALALGELRAETAVKALAQILTTHPDSSGDHAADALAKIGSPSAEVLIEAMKRKRPWVRRRAAKALIPVESKAAIPVLFEALEDESYVVRHYAEEALRRMGVGQMVYFTL